ncbi:type I toxin-antitoxin system Fst family toxin [Enterococcus olivae]
MLKHFFTLVIAPLFVEIVAGLFVYWLGKRDDN